MTRQVLQIGGIPALLFGEPSVRAYLFLHGKGGSREEAAAFAQIVCPKGYQVIAIDLPEHGERRAAEAAMLPWIVIPELRAVRAYLERRYEWIGLRANSIGAWFAMLAFRDKTFDRCLFVSPILDMELLIEKMMVWASVTETQLRQADTIPTTFGETLSWKYLSYVRTHPTSRWTAMTCILWAGQDHMTDRATVDRFASAHRCSVTVLPDGEHWFHTEEQLAFLRDWENAKTEPAPE